MYSIVRHVPIRKTLFQEAPTFTVAFLIAELFFKWGSFSLECFGFLGVWFCLSFVTSWLTDSVSRPQLTAQDNT